MNKDIKYLIELGKHCSVDYSTITTDVNIDDINDLGILKDILKSFYYGVKDLVIVIDPEHEEHMSKETKEWLHEYKKNI